MNVVVIPAEQRGHQPNVGVIICRHGAIDMTFRLDSISKQFSQNGIVVRMKSFSRVFETS